MYDVAIIGGGASGIFCAIILKRLNKDLNVTIYEAQNKIGKKILQTGNGKCNLSNTNVTSLNYNTDLIDNVLKQFDYKKLIDILNDLKENTKRKVFAKPTVEEVKAYCVERKNNVNPDKFIDFYESKGWLIGKNPMKDWKACVRTWEKGSTSPPNKPSNAYINPSQKEFDDLSGFYAN